MDKQKTVHITIFQAPFASLMERGLYQKMLNFNHTFQERVPAEYYLVAFNGEVECPAQLPEDRELVALIPIGYPDETPVAPRRKPVDELLSYLS